MVSGGHKLNKLKSKLERRARGAKKIRPIIIALLGVILFAPQVALSAEACSDDWTKAKPYLIEFFQIDGDQQKNLIANFNNHAPLSDHKPEIVGYINTESWELIQLLMFEGGCLIVDQPYPRTVVWQMMGSVSTEVEFDKTGKTYADTVEANQADIDAAYKRTQEREKEMVGLPDEPQYEMPLAGGVGEMD